MSSPTDPEAQAHPGADDSEAPTSEIGAISAEFAGFEALDQVAEKREASVSTDAEAEQASQLPALGERAKLRRRARYLRRLREIQLRDIGGLLVELHRFGRERPDLVQAKVATAAETATELREIQSVLADGRALRELREAGIGGACSVCGAVHGSRDHFCAACGAPLAGEHSEPAEAVDEPAEVNEPAALVEPEATHEPALEHDPALEHEPNYAPGLAQPEPAYSETEQHEAAEPPA